MVFKRKWTEVNDKSDNMRRVRDKLLNISADSVTDQMMVKFSQCYQCVSLGFGP